MSTLQDTLIADLLHASLEAAESGAPMSPAISPTSTFVLPGEPKGAWQYGRMSNPTWTEIEQALSHLEQAPTVVFPSGMAAIAGALMSNVTSGDRILLPSDGYYTTRVMAERYLVPMGVEVVYCATADIAGHPLDGYRIVYIETPSNPGLDLCDIAAVSERCKLTDALLIADNTTMTPLGQRPLDLGADIVLASDTKALNGHSDALFGHVATRDEGLLERVREWRKLIGAIPGPFEAWQVLRGLQTLELRFERMSSSAMTLASRLHELHPTLKVIYPGLPHHPSHSLACKQMSGFGTLLDIEFSSAAKAEQFMQVHRYLVPATSFGGTHSSAERRARWGDSVAEGFLRWSVGIEPIDVLWEETVRALSLT